MLPSRPSTTAVLLSAAACIAAAVAGAAGMLVARQAGVVDGSTSPTFAVTGLLGTVVCSSVAVVLRVRFARGQVALRLVVAAAFLATYLLVSAICAMTVGQSGLRGPGADWLVALQACGFVPAISALQVVALLTARDYVPGLGRRLERVLLGSAVLGIGLGLVAVEPSWWPGVEAPLARATFPGAEVAFGLLMACWMLAVLATAVVVGRAIPRGHGPARRRLALLTCAAVIPVWTITVCMGLTLVIGGDGDSDGPAVELLAAAFGLPFAVAPVLVGLAVAASDARLRELAPTVVGISFTVALGGLAGVVAAGIGVAVVSANPDWTVIAVLAAVVTATALGFARRQWQAHLHAWLDPDRALALALLETTDAAEFLRSLERLTGVPQEHNGAASPGPLLDRLSPREREVLALISEGRSNASVAGALVLSERTIDTHVRSIFAKLELDPDADANRRVRAAAYWIRASTGRDESGAGTDGTGGRTS